MRSSGRILHFGRPQHFAPEMRTEILRRTQVDQPASEQSRKVGFDGRKADQSRFLAGRELDEDIEVAIRSRGAMQRRAEKRQSPDGVPPTELGKSIAILCQRMNHGAPSLATWGTVCVNSTVLIRVDSYAGPRR